MNTAMLTRARRHFCSDFVPQIVNRRYMRSWVRSVRLLGSKWLLAAPIAAKLEKHSDPV